MRWSNSLMALPSALLLAAALTATSVIADHAPVLEQVSVSDALQRGFDAYRRARYPEVESACDGVIATLQSQPSLDSVQLQLLLTAYELRARARFLQKNSKGAYDDFKAMLTKAPTHVYGTATRDLGTSLNPESETLFEEVRKEVVGSLTLTVMPADAEVKLDGAVLSREQRNGSQPIIVVVGTHRVSAQKPGHTPRDEQVDVLAGPGTPVSWILKRVTSKIDVITSPGGVEVLLDGVSKGRTPAGPPEKYASADDVVALGARTELSGILEILDVATGTRDLEFRRDCYKTVTEKFSIGEPEEYRVARKLARESSRLTVKGSGGLVFIDGIQKGPVPYEQDLCPKPQPQVIEVRTDRGRQIQRVTPQAGIPIPVIANPKPAIAILSQVNVREGSRDDLRLGLEAALQSADTATFFAPSADLVQRELAAEALKPGWLSFLSFDRTGQRLPPSAIPMSRSTRLALSTNLSKRLEVQGIAEIYVPAPDREPRALRMTYVAAGSSVPETIEINLDDQGSIRKALAVLNATYPTSSVSAGMEVADIQGAGGAVVLRQVWDLTNGVRLFPGDLIAGADGAKIDDGSAFEALVSKKKQGEQIVLQVKGKDGTKSVTLKLQNFSRVVGFLDETLPINKLILDSRNAALDAPNPQEQSIARLNLAVVLMRALNWEAALNELEKVDLKDLTPPQQAVSRGTVQVLSRPLFRGPRQVRRGYEGIPGSGGISGRVADG